MDLRIVIILSYLLTFSFKYIVHFECVPLYVAASPFLPSPLSLVFLVSLDHFASFFMLSTHIRYYESIKPRIKDEVLGITELLRQ